MLHMSMATTRTASRHAGDAPASQYAASSAVRPSTCPSSACSPDRSKKRVCHRSASSTYSPVSPSRSHRAAPAVLIDAQVRHRGQGLLQHGARGGGERLVCHRPGDPGVPGRLRRGDPAVADLGPGLLPQPGRDPAPRRHLRQPLGERLRPQASSSHFQRHLTHHTATRSPPRRTSRGRASTVSCRRPKTVPQSGPPPRPGGRCKHLQVLQRAVRPRLRIGDLQALHAEQHRRRILEHDARGFLMLNP